MTGQARPLLIGYFQEDFFSTPAEQTATRRQLEEFATREGFTVHSILFERYDQKWTVFERLIELAKGDGVRTIAIPKYGDLNADQRNRLADAAVTVVTTSP
jgi:hypothetical protein